MVRLDCRRLHLAFKTFLYLLVGQSILNLLELEERTMERKHQLEREYYISAKYNISHADFVVLMLATMNKPVSYQTTFEDFAYLTPEGKFFCLVYFVFGFSLLMHKAITKRMRKFIMNCVFLRVKNFRDAAMNRIIGTNGINGYLFDKCTKVLMLLTLTTSLGGLFMYQDGTMMKLADHVPIYILFTLTLFLIVFSVCIAIIDVIALRYIIMTPVTEAMTEVRIMTVTPTKAEADAKAKAEVDAKAKTETVADAKTEADAKAEAEFQA